MDRRGESDEEVASTKGCWSSQFGTRKHSQKYEQENKSYTQDVHPSTEDDIIKSSMQQPSNTVLNPHRNDCLAQFFKNSDLNDLERNMNEACSRPNPLLDDRKPHGFGNSDEDIGFDNDDSEDVVKNYSRPATSPDDLRADPASGGNIPASPSLSSLRVHFLQVLVDRIGKVKDEWANIVSMIKSRLESHVSSFEFLRSQINDGGHLDGGCGSRTQANSENSFPQTQHVRLSCRIQQQEEHSDRFEQLSTFYARTRDTIRLLHDLKYTISKTIHAWDAFRKFELGYFSNDQVTGKDARSLVWVIMKHFGEIELLYQALNEQKSVCKDNARELEQQLRLLEINRIGRIQLEQQLQLRENNRTTQIQLEQRLQLLENNRTIWIQLQSGEDTKAITMIGVLVSPLSIAAAIFSMGPDILPFRLNFASFVITVIILFILMLALLWIWRWLSRRKLEQAFRSTAEPSLFQINSRIHDLWDQENQRYRSSLVREPVEDGIEMQELPATGPRNTTQA